MEVYTGTLNWLGYAINEPIIVLLPLGLVEGKAVLMYWKWTKDSKGLPNQGPVQVKSHFTYVVSYYDDPETISTQGEFTSYYWFRLVRTSGNTGLNLKMNKQEDGSSSLENPLTRVFEYPSSPMKRVEVYAGRLNWGSHAHQELFVAIFYDTIEHGKDMGLFWGWTAEGAAGEAKGPAEYQATTYTVSDSDGVITIQSATTKNKYSVKGIQRRMRPDQTYKDCPLYLTLSLEGKDGTADRCEMQLQATSDY